MEDSLEKFVEVCSALGRPYTFKFFKGCLPQILFGPFLNALSHIHFLWIDFNECLINNGRCSANAQCTNVIGGTRICTCNAGYTGDGITCTGKKIMVFQSSSILS